MNRYYEIEFISLQVTIRTAGLIVWTNLKNLLFVYYLQMLFILMTTEYQ
jgi:hypothetical protein